MTSHILLLTLAFLLSLPGFYRLRRKTRLPLPPGPKRYPIVGNLFDKPADYQWIKYFEWSKEYNSDVIYFSIFGKPTIVLNSRKAVNDLLLARSLLYSDRPTSTMINELLGWESMFSFAPYGQPWRARRRAFSQEFTSGQSVYHRPKQLRNIRGLLRRILNEPDDFFHHISYSLSTSIISIAYGLEVKPENDHNIQLCEAAIGQLSRAALHGDYLVDVLPILKHVPSWIPGAGFKAYAEEARPKTMAMLEVPYGEARERIRYGTIEQSIVSSCLARGDAEEDVIRDVASIAYAGGSETSHVALKTFFVAMVLYPDVQKRGQQELDTYAGSQLPTFDDLPHMPYVHAIMLEVLRWQAVLPLGVAHRLTEDDTYNGYYLPKGATVLANTWALLRDEEYYPDPDGFYPDRFLKDGKINPKLCEAMPNFGYGRRICPGRHFAMDSLQMSIASILAVFNIDKARDDRGQVMEPEIEYISGFTRHLRPFKCAITPRSPEAEKLVNNADFL
ncbi:cytochrome P450 family protein [Pleurotus pulmonarius]